MMKNIMAENQRTDLTSLLQLGSHKTCFMTNHSASHSVTQSFNHLNEQSLNHSVIQSVNHLKTQSFSHPSIHSG